MVYWLYGLAPLSHLYTLARISCWPPEDCSICDPKHVGVNFTWTFNVFLINIELWVHELVIIETLRIKSISSYVWITESVQSVYEHYTGHSNTPAHLKPPYITCPCARKGQIVYSSGRYEQANVESTWNRELHTVFQKIRTVRVIYPQNPKRFVFSRLKL